VLIIVITTEDAPLMKRVIVSPVGLERDVKLAISIVLAVVITEVFVTMERARALAPILILAHNVIIYTVERVVLISLALGMENVI